MIGSRMLPQETFSERSTGSAQRSSRELSPTRSAGPTRLSQTLWGLDWERVLPCTFSDGFVARASSLAGSAEFVRDHYAAIFEQTSDSPFANDLSEAKARYYELADFIQFVRGDSVVGLVIGAPSDWGTYYVRSAAVLPEQHGAAIVQRFFYRVLFPVLTEHGVERVEADVAPSNLAMVHIVTRAQFNASGTFLTERWGAHTRFTKFLSPNSEQVFLKQFCSGVKYQLRDGRARVVPEGGEKGDAS